MLGNTNRFSYSAKGFSQEDFPQQRRDLQQDDPKNSPFQRNGLFRPSGRAIYMQRKEYSELLNKQPDNFQVRVEHLFTCELDGQEVRTMDDCVARLKMLDSKGQLWPQQMIMEIQGENLLLSDIETKVELESMPLSCIMQTRAVLDSCAYNSLLTVTVQERSKRVPQVYMFQCEETGAEIIKNDLDKSMQRGGGSVDQHREHSDIRSNLENIIGQQASGSFWQGGPRPVPQERIPPPPDHMAPQWNSREPEYMPPPQAFTPQEESVHYGDPREMQSSPEMVFEGEVAERNTEILNHVIDDLEIFMGKALASKNAPVPQEEKSKKKSGNKKKKSKKNEPNVILPSWVEYVDCLQKIKYGFNLLGQLDGVLTNPSAPDFVHIFFNYLGTIVPLYPADMPPTVVSPLLTERAVQLLSQVVDPQEDGLWRSLGECWNIPRSNWPEDVPPYIPEFYDGWQPPPPVHRPSSPPHHNTPMSRSNSQRFPAGRPDEGPNYSPRAMQHPEEPMPSGPWSARPNEPPLYMNVIYNFMARNNQELSIMKGEVVRVVKKTKQWWLVRNSSDVEGFVPQNVLEPMSGGGPEDSVPWDNRNPVTLDMQSTPAEVKAWLRYKGFSKITVASLGVLSGRGLLEMSKDEIRTVCPEEGSKVFFQLQAIKSSVALASEQPGMYNGPPGMYNGPPGMHNGPPGMYNGPPGMYNGPPGMHNGPPGMYNGRY
ncbi:epidermal growth factor receptor kinase substrate 8-like protein 3b [Melanotaenia boesemani]|uniref:epidermal growth factor receptor kinase substrate 8-like protein 3b n=1 Tax=Melanotaenia boesemani TaxID=1250792 RepID=UPI001C050D00|nr:epidermal growth factor receptor kinase substrate 8-like protein 3b [Melanotaenia boesemani]